ncbi:GntR family transcriptional regulator [Tepidiphilus baoligensis]|nr:GntR family transcriptional regulator [Tepidiphilus baoligensis]
MDRYIGIGKGNMTNSSPNLLAAGQPRYLVLAQALIDDIRVGRYPIGSLLPSENELCQQFSVSRHTVREAIRRLLELGLVTRQPGVGTKVKATRIASRYIQASESISDLFQYVHDVRLKICSSEEVFADEQLADLLECQVGQAWLKVSGERYIPDQQLPLSLTDVYIARPYYGVLDALDDPSVPIYSIIEQKYGVMVVEVRQEISAVLIDDTAASRLGTISGAAGLRVVRKYFATNGELFEVAVNLYPGDRFSYSTTQRLARFDGADSQ